MNKKIIVTGSLAFDTIMDFDGNFGDHIIPDKIHSLNLSFLASDMKKTQGGTAGNIAYNLGLLKCNPILLSMFGKEAQEYRKFLQNVGVDVAMAPLSKKYFSSQAFITTDKKDNQIASFYPGAMNENYELKIKNYELSKNSGTFVVISPNTPEAMKHFVEECVQYRIPYMYDPGMQLPRISDEELRYGIKNCEILIGNDYEIELMKKRMGELKVPILITTLGEKGAIIFDNRNIVGVDLRVDPHVDRPGGLSLRQYVIKPSIARKIMDPTGAGDAFRAGFLAGYIRGFDLKICGQMGACNAVYTVEKYGTTTHTFNVIEFAERYKENYGEKLIL